MDALVLIGRGVFALLFVVSGSAHVTKRTLMTAYTTSRGVPAAQLLAPVPGL